MAFLNYDFRVIGANNINNALAGVERRFVQHNSRMARVSGTRMREATPTAARANERATAQMAKAAEREQQRTIKRLDSEKNKAHKAELRRIEAERKARERAEIRATKAAEKATIKAQREFRGEVKGHLGRAGSRLSSIGGGAAGALSLAAGGMITAGIVGGVDLERRQRGLITNARGAGQSDTMSQRDLGSRVNAAAIATGASAGDITGALEGFVQKTGDLRTAVANMQNFATIAVATGSSVEDVASAAADLSQKFDLKSPEQMSEALAKLAFQGKNGAFELRDMAAQFPKIASAASRFGFTGAQGVAELGGFAQIARGATGSGEEAATAVEASLRQLIAKSGQLKSGAALGKRVDVFEGGDAKNRARNFREVVEDVISTSGGDKAKLQKLFDDQGIRGVSPLVTAYSNASIAAREAGGTNEDGDKAGRAAIRKMFSDSIDAAGSFKDSQRDAADNMKTASSQLQVLNTQFQAAVQRDLLPAVLDLVPEITKAVPLFSQLVKGLSSVVKFITENPWSALGHVIAARVAMDIAGAKIGTVVSTALTNAITGTSGTPGGKGATKSGFVGAGGIAGAVLSGLTIAALAVEAISVGTIAVDSLINNDGKEETKRRIEIENSKNTGRDFDLANMSPEQRKAAMESLRKEEKSLESAKTAIDKETAQEQLRGFGPAGELLGIKPDENLINALKEDRASADAAQEKLVRALEQLRQAIPRDFIGPLQQPPNRTNSPSPVKD